MVDIGIASASSGTDAVARLRSGRGRNSDDDSSGFQDVLGSAANGQGLASADADESDAAPDQAAAQADLSKDLDAESILAPAAAGDETTTQPVVKASTDIAQSAKSALGKSASDAKAALQATNATVADAMASLGLTSGNNTDVSTSVAAGAAPASPNAPKTATPQFSSTLSSLKQPVATADVPADPVDGSASAPVARGQQDATPAVQPVADMMQQLAAVSMADSTSGPSTTGKTTATKQSAENDDASTDAETQDASSEVGTDAPAGAVNDALSLLNAMTPAAMQAQATSALAGNGGQVAPASGKAQLLAGGTSAVQTGKVTTVTGDASAATTADTLAIPSSSAADVAGLVSRGIGKGTTSSTTDDSSADTFRVTRAGGKVQAVDAAIGKSADDATQLDAKSASGGTDTVTVLDQRRYLGLADGSNSALVTSALAGDKTLANALKTSAAAAIVAPSATSKVVNTLKIQMNPEKLGTVTATMRLQGEALSVDLKVQSAEAYRQLSNDQSAIVDSLRSQGYQVDNITVTYAPQQSADAGSQQNSQAGFQGQQQSGASQGQGGEAQSRRQNSGQQANDQDRLWGAQNGSADDGAAGSSQRTRSAGVYL